MTITLEMLTLCLSTRDLWQFLNYISDYPTVAVVPVAVLHLHLCSGNWDLSVSPALTTWFTLYSPPFLLVQEDLLIYSLFKFLFVGRT